jgi:hypothetical protein
MRIPVFRHGQIAVLAFGIGLVAIYLALPSGTCFAMTPESPEVMAAINKGIAFLESDSAEDDRVGARALQCLCMLKITDLDPENHKKVDPAHPKFVKAIERIQKALGNRDIAKLEAGTWDIYSTGLAIIFLVEFENKINQKPPQASKTARRLGL